MSQPSIPPTPASASVAGKTAIITGGNTGIGYEVARQLLLLKASRVIITVRSTSKGQEAVASLRAHPEVKKANPTATIEFFHLDLDDSQSGVEFAERVRAEVPELHLLICNGGVNLMSYEAMILELLPLLRATAVNSGEPSRLTFVGSSNQNLHTLATKPLADSKTVIEHCDDGQTYSGLRRYADSKFVVHAFVQRLASIVPSSEIIVNDPCPGMVATNFDRGLPLWFKPIMFVVRKLMARTVDEGARTIIYAAVVAGQETHGKFLQSNKVDPAAPIFQEKAGQTFVEKLWKDAITEASQHDAALQSFA
ncbi:Short-chain dehydrogenase/reductase SDR [Penicillium italicum]|uniref:Short-chain dehydrogenase/reductase SDR n=1 Tax=Penicillium italicum TaxID=40296 RepID=A0A0A2KUK9_PENIT|nr:Short-chain dehydrogenase/reductase SDR [Penicillium italicum]